MNVKWVLNCCLAGAAGWAVLSTTGCSPSKGNALDELEKARISIGEHTFEVWIAADEATREKGLMFVPADALADLPDGAHRGMLFVFEQEKQLSFWMKNTITALDIAYVDAEGVIVKTHTMKPLDLGGYPSERPARFALEVKANLFADLDIKAGHLVQIPDAVLKADE